MKSIQMMASDGVTLTATGFNLSGKIKAVAVLPVAVESVQDFMRQFRRSLPISALPR